MPVLSHASLPGLGSTPCIKGLLKKKRTKNLLGKLPLKASAIQTALLEASVSFQNGVTAVEMQPEKLFSYRGVTAGTALDPLSSGRDSVYPLT